MSVLRLLVDLGEYVAVARRDQPRDTRFGEDDSHILRVCSIASSCSSIVSGVLAIYMFGAIDYKKRVFRHQLIIFLIFFDLIKLAVLLIYPSRIETKFLAYYNHNFCEVVGFFTSLSIEGADIAILSFAIHTGLLIFRPNAKIKNGNNLEGGLFKFRFYVYLISFLTPCLLLSLAFINGSGYQPLTTWCYLPQEPRWYRLVLSWVPRYLIVITIVCIYVSIYYYVTKQYSIVGGNFKDMHLSTVTDELNTSQMTRHWNRFKNGYFFVQKIITEILFPEMTMFPMFEDEEANDLHNSPSEKSSKKMHLKDIDENGNYSNQDTNKTSNEQGHLREGLHRETYNQFQIRRLQIQKQMKSIFIYPISYIFLWSFPFILQCFEFHNPNSRILWLNAVLAFFQPFNCTVDTLVFVYRERPWTITTIQTDTNPLEQYEYPRWRRALSWLPLYSLPTLESKRKLYYAKVQNKLEEQKLRSASNSSESSPNNENNHDFSNIIAGNDIDFIKLPNPTLKRPSNTGLRSFRFDNELTPIHLMAESTTDPNDQDIAPDQKRRRSSKFSWLSNFSTLDGRRSSGNISVISQQQQRKKSNNSLTNESDHSAASSSHIFSQSYSVTDNTNQQPNLPEISEQITNASNLLRPQLSPTSPLQSSTNFTETRRGSYTAPSHQPSRTFTNAFGLTRRPSFFESNHPEPTKNHHINDETRNNILGTTQGIVEAKSNEEREDDNDEDDMDFMDFLKKGPPA